MPERTGTYELGGYPVLKKWLGYRDAKRRNNQPLSLAEKDYFQDMVQRITALISLGERLDEPYEKAAANAFVADIGDAAAAQTALDDDR